MEISFFQNYYRKRNTILSMYNADLLEDECLLLVNPNVALVDEMHGYL